MSDLNASLPWSAETFRRVLEVQTEIERLVAQRRLLTDQIDRLEQQRWQIALGLAPTPPEGEQYRDECETACQQPQSAQSEFGRSSYEPQKAPPLKESKGVGTTDSKAVGRLAQENVPSLEDRITELEHYVCALTQIAFISTGALPVDLPALIRKVAQTSDPMTDRSREFLRLMAGQLEKK